MQKNISQTFLGKMVNVQMDRPLGTKHPKHGFVYEVNYGFIPNTISGDGEELDAYVLGPDKPLNTDVVLRLSIAQMTTMIN